LFLQEKLIFIFITKLLYANYIISKPSLLICSFCYYFSYVDYTTVVGIAKQYTIPSHKKHNKIILEMQFLKINSASEVAAYQQK
jgi:hypothetical protein